jgi:DNA repair protein RadA/Sms
MVKAKTVFVCQQCGAESPKWMGKCSNCGEWGSLVEMTLEREGKRAGEQKRKTVKPQKLTQIASTGLKRFSTKIEELDRVLGGGIVPGMVVLVAGEPGIGKSTLVLQLVAQTGGLYISGEESLEQLKIRAERLKIKAPKTQFLAETDVDAFLPQIEQLKPRLAIVDSIQSLSTTDLAGAAGSVGQVRECASRLTRLAKREKIAIFLVGHVTKEGTIAGPKVLEHMVDTVIALEGERFGQFRLLRATKNRFGATDEVGVFEMRDTGLKEVANPSRLFLKERVKKVPGSVVVATMEGTRPVLAEIQALVVPTQLAVPRRVGQGVDYHRLQLISAVLAKRLGWPLASFDIFVNVAGGLQVKEPAADLGMGLAIASSFKNIALEPGAAVFGEIGLLGEMRKVGQVSQRIKEAKRLGFTRIISPERFSSINQVVKNLLKSG